MKTSRYATSRQKACLRCSAAKVKCDCRLGRCSRCVSKDLACSYTHGASPGSVHETTDNAEASLIDHGYSIVDSLYAHHSVPDSGVPLRADTHTSHSTSGVTNPIIIDSASPELVESHLLGSHLIGSTASTNVDVPGPLSSNASMNPELCCPVDADAIRNRWLNAYLPVPGQKSKEYSAPITLFIYRILKAYAAIATHGRGVPPFVHASQVAPDSTSQPLATCLTLVRMRKNPLPGSEGVAIDVLQREMGKIYDHHDECDDRSSLATFQAYLIYSMVLFFHLGQAQNPALREAMMNLQQLACATSHRGLMCIAEREHARPRWEAWVLVEAKRRTLYMMYLFDGVLSAQDGLPNVLGTELTGLPAPSNKQLWQAQTQQVWEAAYNAQLAQLAQSLRIDELWPVAEELDDAGLIARRHRVDLWLQEVDEYGIMLYAITSCTHGS